MVDNVFKDDLEDDEAPAKPAKGAKTVDRTPRELESRAVSKRQEAWAQPDLLPEPDKQPGYVYRWVRVALNNANDPRNISAKLREGWEPVSITEQPKFSMLVDSESRFKDNIEIGGLLLCKMPAEFLDQRNAYYRNKTAEQARAVDNNLMKQNDARMPLFKESNTKVTFGKG